MQNSTGVPPSPIQDTGTASMAAMTIRALCRDRPALCALVFLGFVVLVAVVGPLVVTTDPNSLDLRSALVSPNSEFWLGTDDLGRDQFSRLVDATRITLAAASEAVLVSVIIGLPLGLVAGYLGGSIDAVFGRLNDALMSVPALLLAVAVVAVVGPGLTTSMFAIGVVFSPSIFRIVRGATMAVRSETYIEAAVAIGCRPLRVMSVHVLRNTFPPVLVQISLLFGVAMIAEANLSFLGLGVTPPQASWGSLLRTAFDNFYAAPFLMFAPGLAIALTVLAFSQIGDGLRAAVGDKKGMQ
ncbi:ABC transporter permease [Nocardia carnea]|uniref:ABC transporter permease n=1 Tax=Nocardia carnea TaxID=37328 RepID=UPI002458A01A|nr:ABC transporter permease [Nocardia carnea]